MKHNDDPTKLLDKVMWKWIMTMSGSKCVRRENVWYRFVSHARIERLQATNLCIYDFKYIRRYKSSGIFLRTSFRLVTHLSLFLIGQNMRQAESQQQQRMSFPRV